MSRDSQFFVFHVTISLAFAGDPQPERGQAPGRSAGLNIAARASCGKLKRPSGLSVLLMFLARPILFTPKYTARLGNRMRPELVSKLTGPGLSRQSELTAWLGLPTVPGPGWR